MAKQLLAATGNKSPDIETKDSLVLSGRLGAHQAGGAQTLHPGFGAIIALLPSQFEGWQRLIDGVCDFQALPLSKQESLARGNRIAPLDFSPVL
nr:hypothetical protein [Pigmentiphaga humi]